MNLISDWDRNQFVTVSEDLGIWLGFLSVFRELLLKQ